MSPRLSLSQPRRSLLGYQAVATVWLVMGLLNGPVFPKTASAATASELYENALSRERALAAPSRPQPPSLRELQTLIRRYEGIVRQYPRSGYCDNALWQAAGLALTAFKHYAHSDDRRNSEKFLELIQSEYPSSSLISAIPTRRDRLEAIAASHARLRPTLVTSIERALVDDGVRVTIGLDAEVAYQYERLANPDRVFFDLHNTEPAQHLLDGSRSFSNDVVRKIRVGRRPNDTTRVVLDLANVQNYSVFALYNPYRLVIDTVRGPNEPIPPELARLAPEPLPPTANASGDFSLSRQLGLGVRRIVIDPGHGGHDPGTRGSGVSEADLVLDIALRLRTLVAMQPSTDVVLTRETNTFIPLEERPAIANRSNADLFLSIHVNASTNPRARGIETYFLNFASNPDAESLAARENASSSRTMARLQGLVQTIALNDKLDESREFAEMVQDSLEEQLRPTNPTLQDLGVKQAPFIVLIGAKMPSVLTEVSFLSNQAEALLLTEDDYRQRIAQALFNAVLRYQRTLKNVQVATRP